MNERTKDHNCELSMDIAIEDFDSFYWMKDDLIAFAREQGLRTDGYKPQLTARIRLHLQGKLPLQEPPKSRSTGRDSDQTLTRDTPVENFKSDQKTRDFFENEIGPEFHFTYKLNQFHKKNSGLTYGDLIGEWLAERDRRKDKSYKPVLEKHGEYNLFVRGFFSDPTNEGCTMRDAADAWNKVKPTQDRSYENFKAMRGQKSAK